MEKKNKIVLLVIVFFIALLCIFYISNGKLKFDTNKWDKVSHRMEIIFHQRYIPLNFNETLVFNIKE